VKRLNKQQIWQECYNYQTRNLKTPKTVINIPRVLRALVEKVDTIEKHMNDINKELKIKRENQQNQKLVL
jgi:hypothetical protein